MPIQIHLVDGEYCPMIFCEVCGERLHAPGYQNREQFRPGAYAFPMFDNEGTTSNLWFYCKMGDCYRRVERAIESEYPDVMVGWDELDFFLLHLGNNLEIASKRVFTSKKNGVLHFHSEHPKFSL